MARLRSDFWVAAYLRRWNLETVQAVLRRRGAPEAGAILIRVDCLDGTSVLYGPTPQSEVEGRDAIRSFTRMHKGDTIETPDAEARLKREISFDPDLWIIDVDDRAGRMVLD